MPTISLRQYIGDVFVRGIRQIPFLNLVEYDKAAAKRVLAEELGWRDYGGKHYESVWTRFYQGYYLLKKFGFDKRKAHFSSLVCAGQMQREEALQELENPSYPPDLLETDLQFVLKKFGLSVAEFESMLSSPGRRHQEYPGNFFLLLTLRKYKNVFRRIATTP